MGGRGGSYSRSASARLVRMQASSAQAQQAPGMPTINPPDDDTAQPLDLPDVNAISSLDDSQLAALVQTAQTIDMPYHLKDAPCFTQQFVYAAGLNAKPTVLDAQAFDDYLTQNGIPQANILARSANGGNYGVNGVKFNMTDQQVSLLLADSKLTYIGGKHGGSVYGCGAYFAQTGGQNTGYGGHTITGVLNPATAHVISKSQLIQRASSFAASHPQFARAVGGIDTGWADTNNLSVYALAMGYNVISDGGSGYGTYYNIIDRSALVLRK